MPLTKLDTISALIVIDLQKGILGSPTVHPVADIIGRAAQLARAFRERRLPVLLVNVTGVPPGRSDVAPRTSSFPADLTELSWIAASPQRPHRHKATMGRVHWYIIA
jgi:nicotinamidase-related amidase